MSLRVGLDLAILRRARTTGWERMARDLAEGLRTSTEVDVAPLAPRARSRSRVGFQAQQGAWHLRGLRRAAASASVEAVHAPTLPPPPLPVPTVWTLHDTLLLGLEAQWARPGTRLWVGASRRALGRVDLIVTDTASIADELAAHGVERRRLAVIGPPPPDLPPPGAPPRAMPAGSSEPVILEAHGFLLAVGTVERRKDPLLLADVARRTGVPVVLAGAHAFDRMGELRGSGVVVTGRVTDEELSWLYDAAGALISASRYEGLDYPVLEALARGLPVVCSDIPVHREVGGDRVRLFAPGDAAAAARHAAEAMSLPRVRGPAPPSNSDFAAAHAELYRRLLGR